MKIVLPKMTGEASVEARDGLVVATFEAGKAALTIGLPKAEAQKLARALLDAAEALDEPGERSPH